jgi:hypothetical protein
MDRHLHLLFLLVAAPLMLFFALAVPVGQVPDEIAHILRADSVRLGTLIGYRAKVANPSGPDAPAVRGAAIRVDAGLSDAAFVIAANTPHDPLKMTSELLARWHAIPWANHRIERVAENVAPYAPLFYLPAAIAMGAAKLAGAPPASAILAARLANTACYLLLGAVALLLARSGRTVLLALLLLPMSLSLGASCNQDGLVIAVAALTVALLSRTGPTAPERWSWWLGAGALACVILAKPPYLPLAALLLLPLPLWRADLADPAAMRARIGAVLLASVPGILWAAAAAAWVSTPFLWPMTDAAPYTPGLLYTGDPSLQLWTTDPTRQLHILLAHPSLFVTLPVARVLSLAWTGELHRTFIGVLGTLSVVLPAFLYKAWICAFGATCAADIVADRPVPGTQRGVPDVLTTVAVVLLTIWGILISLYLTWTKLGQAGIDGVQGRYLIPVALLALPGLPRLGLGTGVSLRAAAALFVLAVALLGDQQISDLFLLRHYVR